MQANLTTSMQRRTPPSRLSQRTLGLPNRIWLILALFGSLLLLTRFVLPAHTTDATYYLRHHSSSYSASLKPHNYLNVSEAAGPNPFAFCPTFGEGDELSNKYGSLTVSQSWLHLGSGARVQKVIHKALLGQPVTISVIGGSVSACHGAGDDPISTDCYPHKFFDWWNTIFPHPASELTNGAMRRTNSEYFSFCNAHHLPDYTDLVIIELDTDDKGDKETLDHFELLVRSILLRSDSPAIILLGHFSPQIQQQNGFSGPETWHSVVAQYYDVPHVSTKSALYGPYMSSPIATQQYYVDPILANSAGHSILADMLVAYVQSQVCLAWAASRGAGSALPVYYALGGGPEQVKQPTDARKLFGGTGLRNGDGAADGSAVDADKEERRAAPAPAALAAHLRVPAARIGTRPDDMRTRVLEEVAPFCVSANDLVNPLPPSLFYGSGWHAHHPPGAAGAAAGAVNSAAHYWYSTLPTSRLRINLAISGGDVGVYYLREPREVLAAEGGSEVACWVDDNYGGRVAISNVGGADEAEPTLRMIDHWVARGPHFVECELLGEEGQTVTPFRIIGVFAT
ncbi:hypothetical protein K488DRAFT_78133 [Vararia minispora EC-137]|uniref:Uncharacterized protein n=1 Tax=Vararia minispora EC-137 TaxID=1314806 RepID=A0ACB8QMX3_9AGAM|nr:hypothetical protein K488DRAFT_78133 [Vararia minispora EC-137]